MNDEWETIAVGDSGGGSSDDEWETVSVGSRHDSSFSMPQFDMGGSSFGGTPQSYQPQSSSQLLGSDQSLNTQRARLGVGGLSKLIPFNLGDEVVAGGSSLVDALMGRGSVSDSYNNRLNEVRNYQKAFDKEAGGWSTAVDVGGALAMPLGSGVGAVEGLLPKMGVAAAEGGALGGAYGYGGGQGQDDRLAKALSGAEMGAAISPAFPLAGAGLSKAGEVLGDTGRKLELSAFGANKTRIAKANKKVYELVDDAGNYENPISDAIASFRSEGGGKNMDPAMLLRDLNKQSTALGDDITAKLANAEKNQTDVIIPAFTRTDDYIAGLSGADKTTAQNLATKLKNDIVNNMDGSLTSVQSEKVKLGQAIKDVAYGSDNGPLRTNILKRIRSDLRQTVEDNYASLTGGKGEDVANVNRELGKRATLEPMFEDMLAGGESRNVVNWLMQNMRTSGGFGMATLGAGAALGPAAAAIPLVGGALITPPGRKLMGDAATALGRGYSSAGQGLKASQGQLEALVGALTSQGQSASPSQSYQSPASPSSYRGAGSLSPSAPSVSNSARTLRNTQQPGPTQRTVPQNTPISKTDIKALFEQQPPLVRAIIKAESANEKNPYGRARAVSEKGAQGLMQLMPEIQKAFDVSDPFDPAENIRGGIALLKEELERFDDPRLAIAAYNAGSPKVQKAIKLAGSNDYDSVRPYLPAETRKYLDTVLANMSA